jgi:hypothetical protein
MNENDLLAALLGYGGGTGSYGYTGTPSGYNPIMGYNYSPYGGQPTGYDPYGMGGLQGPSQPPTQNPGSSQPYLPANLGTPMGDIGYGQNPNLPMTDPNNQGYWGPGGLTQGQNPFMNIGQVPSQPAGNNKGGPAPAGNPGGPAGAPPAVGSPGWVSGHPDYKTNFLGGNAPAVGSPGWMGTHPNYQPGVAAVTRGDPAAPPTVGSPGWVQTHPGYQNALDLRTGKTFLN